MRVVDHMTPHPTTVPTTLSTDGAATLLRAYGIQHLPVVDPAGRLVGIVSDRDLHRPALPSATGGRRDRRVGDVMTTPVLTVGPEAPVRDAVHRMLRGRVHALAVVDGDRRIVGVLTTTDCLCASLRSLPLEAPDEAGAPAP